MLFRAEIVGEQPRGLTRNDVYASIISMVAERTILESSTHWKLLGGKMAVKVRFHALNENEAKATLTYAAGGVTGFVGEIFNLRVS